MEVKDAPGLLAAPAHSSGDEEERNTHRGKNGDGEIGEALEKIHELFSMRRCVSFSSASRALHRPQWRIGRTLRAPSLLAANGCADRGVRVTVYLIRCRLGEYGSWRVRQPVCGRAMSATAPWVALPPASMRSSASRPVPPVAPGVRDSILKLAGKGGCVSGGWVVSNDGSFISKEIGAGYPASAVLC